MFKEYDVVKLKEDMPSENLSKDDIGAIVMVYEGDPPEYEVEFVDATGQTLALLTVKEQTLVRVEPEELHRTLPSGVTMA